MLIRNKDWLGSWVTTLMPYIEKVSAWKDEGFIWLELTYLLGFGTR